MKVIIISLIILGLAFAAKHKVTVYTESYCPGCVEFEAGSLAKFTNNPSKHQLAEVEVIVYGNAHEYKSESGYTYQCQHGEKECRGNLVESCVQKALCGDIAERRLVCVAQSMQSQWGDVESKVYGCLEDEEKDLVRECVNNQSAEVMHDIAQRTKDHKYVPWIMLDGVHSDEIQEKLGDDMVDYLCKLNDLVGKVQGCPAKSYKGKCHNEFFSEDSMKFLN